MDIIETFTVYVHITPNNKLYIGITGRNPISRWGRGKCYYDRHKVRQTPFYNAIVKYGWDNIQHIILMENLSKEVACECEKYLIAKYHTTDRKYGYNITFGGDGTNGLRHSDITKDKLHKSLTGRKLTEEHKKHISEALKGKPHPWQKGKPLSEETKARLSQVHKGHTVNDSTREKIRKANTGKHHSEETRRKLSENSAMHNRPEVVAKVKESLRKTQKERTEKRMKTMKERYPNGLKNTDEQKRKISESLKGRPKSEKHKQSMRHPKSEEHKERMRVAQRISHKARKMGMTYKEYMELTKLSSNIHS